MLAVLEAHPVQYHAPVYRTLATTLGVPVVVVYGSDFSVRGYYDEEFSDRFRWDQDLLSGYDHFFLSTQQPVAADRYADVVARGLGTVLDQLAPSAVLIVGYSSRFDRGALAAALNRRLPILFRGETNDQTRQRSGLHSMLRRMALALLYRQVAFVLPVGRRSREHYLHHGVGLSRQKFSPYCIALTEQADDLVAGRALRASLAPTADLVGLYSGKLVERKGVRLLAQALVRLPDDLRARLKFVFVGDGALADELRTTLEAGRVDVDFVGFKNQRDLRAYYVAADFLVLPSIQGETWGLVVNEALTYGRPVVVSDRVGSAPDLVVEGQTGYTHRSGDVADLVAALTKISQLCQQPTTAAACRAQVAGYSVRHAAEGIASAYAKVGGRRSQR